jgi:hypothetical protein
MNIDDFMSQADSYNQDSETLTGYFGLDDKSTIKKTKSVIATAMTEERKSDIILAIDAITESKIEAIVLTFFAVGKLEEMTAESEMAIKIAPMIAMALSLCQAKGIIDESDIDDAAEVFSKVVSSL